MSLYTVEIDGRRTTVRMTSDTVLSEEIGPDDYAMYPAADYHGGPHNYDGLRGAIIERAIKKLYGRKAFWFGSSDHLDHGQVFRPVGLVGSGENSSCTSLGVISVFCRGKRII